VVVEGEIYIAKCGDTSAKISDLMIEGEDIEYLVVVRARDD
jgi:hypothetical protein